MILKADRMSRTHHRVNPVVNRAFLGGVAVALAAVVTLSGNAVYAEQNAHTGPTRFRSYVEEAGIYSVTFDELQAEGLKQDSIPIEDVKLTNRGLPSPVWIDDKGDGTFGPGDRVIFEGQPLLGTYSYLNEYSRFNCYVVDLSGEPAAENPGEPAADSGSREDVFVREHFEKDIVMARFLEKPDEPKERWFWARLSIMDKQPFRVSTTLRGLSPASAGAASGAPAGAENSGPITLRIAFKGWSNPRTRVDLPDHVVEFTANGKALPNAAWDGGEDFVYETTIQTDLIDGEDLQIQITVPKRYLGDDESDLFVDVVLLNWIEIEYPRHLAFGVGQTAFWVAGPDEHTLEIEAAEDGWLFVGSDRRLPLVQGKNSVTINPAGGELIAFAVVGDGFHEVARLVASNPSNLRDTDRQADYLLITHSSLLDSVKPLAQFHSESGLKVAVVDVEDIFADFNDGIQHPASIKDFISWAYHEWQKPAPRFVLLAGDASWDFKNPTVDDSRYADWTFRSVETKKFIKNKMTPYAEDAELNDRNLVPTWSYRTSQGHSASDNWYVSVEGDDIYPDLAIGRIPVVRPKEMDAVVRKTIAYARSQERGEWQRRVMFITNESSGFQRASDRTADMYEERGYEAIKIYPQKDELVNEEHTANILKEFDEGILLVQFLGHGGRYIWRTGPPDLKKNHDLFTLEHLDQLKPTVKMPVVVSLTCYSAPFDHPSADSIGEKLLRLDGKGAIAVFAASWRNSPSSDMGRIVFDELTRPGATIGEAIMRAKWQIKSPVLVETYNLLGDPAIPIAVSDDVLPPPELEGDAGENPAAGAAESDAAETGSTSEAK